MNWLETKYIGIMSIRLRNFKRKSHSLYNFSCNLCGDSEVDKRKARAYFYVKKGKTFMHCHNCGITIGFEKFLEKIDTLFYNQYSIEKLKDYKSPQQWDLKEFVNKMKKPNFMKSEPLKGLRKISQLDHDDPAKILVSNRKIPNPYHAKMFKVPKFFAWVNSFIPDKFDDEALLYDETRLLIPFLNKNGDMHAFQGRSLNSKSKTKYITIVLDETQPKIYGLDTVDTSKKVYVFEGPIDACFIPNSVATAGGDLAAAVEIVSKDKMVICYDNEPRSRETVKKIDKAIINGYNVCIWPSNLDFKDVNDMILGGLSTDFVRYIIDQNTFRDLRAKVALLAWKKIDA